MRPSLPPPRDPDAPIRDLVRELAARIDEPTAVAACADLLLGADARGHADLLPYLAGTPAAGLLAGTWSPYWGRSWGARGLLYVWDDTATAAVVRGLDDEHWRPAETCLKVAAARELAVAADGAVALSGHELPRVRATAVRMLGRAGDTEHVAVVLRGLDDVHVDVRRAAGLALERMAARLDIDPDLVP